MTKGKVDNDEKITEVCQIDENAPSVPADTETFKILGAGDLRDELLPSIPNDIALQVIAPKLSAREINVLSMVSPSWREAINSRRVYDARVCTHSTEAFIVLLYGDQFNTRYPNYKLSLYSLNDNSVYPVPPTPSPGGIPHRCKCVSLDGKIYILGGALLGPKKQGFRKYLPGSKEVFMFDMAGQRRWKQCASMQKGRYLFGAGVLDGKIYVFGGLNDRDYVDTCEVYDPKVDAWSSIADMIPCLIDYEVAAAGGELFVYGAKHYPDERSRLHDVVAYHPVKNEWRKLERSDTEAEENLWLDAFVAQGKLHKIAPNGVDVYDTETNSWRGLQSFFGFQSFFRFNRIGDFWDSLVGRSGGWAILAFGDEILMLQYDDDCPGTNICRVLRSRGLGSKTGDIALEEIGTCCIGLDQVNFELYYAISLIQV